MLDHGGRLRQAAQRFGIPLGDWLDLSTGINPCGWPVPQLPPTAWARLPEVDDGLEESARSYYGSPHLLAVAGSQAAIQTLPQLRSRSSVGVLVPGYREHFEAWRRGGHDVLPVAEEQIDDRVDDRAIALDVLVLIHPNNPTGTRFSLDRLRGWHGKLAARGGWLVVDEAFIDMTPRASLAPLCPQPGLIVLRSLGKFFGLAGARVGFVLASPPLLGRLADRLGPWAVSSPARWVAKAALAGSAWQQETCRYLEAAGERLRALLARSELSPDGGCALFQWVRTSDAERLWDQLARQGILTRLFEAPPSLRFGLPGSESDWERLEAALAEISPGPPAMGRGLGFVNRSW